MGHATSSADGHVCASPGEAEIRIRPDGEGLPPSMLSVCTESTTPSPIAFGNGRMFWRIVLHDTGVWVLREGV